MDNRILLTVPDVAARLGVGRSFAYELVARGEIVSIKLGKARRIPVAELERYVARLVREQNQKIGG